MSIPKKAIQSLDKLTIINDEDLILVVDKNGKTWLAPRKTLHGKDGKNAESAIGIKKYQNRENANQSSHEEDDLAIIAGILSIYKQGVWKQVVQEQGESIELYPASLNRAGIVKIATKADLEALRDRDGDGNYLVPQISDLLPSFLGTRLIAGNSLAPHDPVYIHKATTIQKATRELVFGKGEENRYLDVQSIANGSPLKTFSVKLSKKGLPTTDLVVEIYKGTKTERYWTASNEKLATTKLSWKRIHNEGKYTFELNEALLLDTGTPLVFRFMLEESIVNELNYYSIFSDPTTVSDIFCSNYPNAQDQYAVYLESIGLEQQVIKRTLNGSYKFGDKFQKAGQRTGELFKQNLAFPEIDPSQPITAKVKASFKTTYDHQSSIGQGEYIPGEITIFGEQGTMSDYWTHEIEFTKQVTIDQLRDFKIRRLIHNHYISLVNPITTVEYSVELSFSEINNALEAQPLYVRNHAKRFAPVVCTVLGLHIDGSFIYPKADGANMAMKGIQGPRGERIQLKALEKKIMYRYEGEENWREIGGVTDFVGERGEQGLQGERGRMGGINYRGHKASLSELPATASIEGEAYSVNSKLYIWDGAQFTEAGPLGNLNIHNDLENISSGFKNLTDLQYDEQHLLKSFTADGKEYTLRHNNKGQLTEVRSGDLSVSISYDDLGKLIGIQ